MIDMQKMWGVAFSSIALFCAAGRVYPASAQTSPRPEFYGAKLEPSAGRVLAGWGQFSSEWNKGTRAGDGDAADLAAYSRAMAPYQPSVLSLYAALDENVMPAFAERYKKLASERSFFVAEVALNFQGIERDVTQGMHDPEIVILMQTLRDAGNPVLLRIGYEFKNPWLPYDPSQYIQSFRQIVGRLQEARLENAATVWNATAVGFSATNFMRWYPGDDVVDWWGVNLFLIEDFDRPQLRDFLDKAREHRKPVVICEAAPVFKGEVAGHVRGPKSEAEAVEWYSKLAKLLREHPEIQAMVLISADFRRLKRILPGAGWPDVRIERWPKAAARWKKELSDKRFVNEREAQTLYHSDR